MSAVDNFAGAGQADVSARRLSGGGLFARTRLPGDALAAGATFLASAAVEHAADGWSLLRGVYWQDWSDQGKYVASVQAFARGDLDPHQHWYPLLYPLLLSAFHGLPIFFAALIVNLCCFVAAYLGFRAVATRFGLSPILSLGVFIAAALVNPQLAISWIVPWTTTLSAALIWTAIGLVARADDPAERGLLKRAGLGFALALIPLCRPADALVSAILAAAAFAPLDPRERLRALKPMAAGAACAIAPYLLLHLAIYGPRATDYMKLSAEFGFDWRHFGWRFVTLFVEARPFYPYGPSVGQRYPWLLLALAGWLVCLWRPDRRRIALIVGLPAFAYAALMTTYADLLPVNVWMFRLIHYYKWTMPAFALFACVFVLSLRRFAPVGMASLALVAPVAFLRYVAVAAAPGEPAKLVLFAAPSDDLKRIYNYDSVVVDGRGPLRNLLDYHQVADGRGFVYAVAPRRDFAGGETWTDNFGGVAGPVFDYSPADLAPLVGPGGEVPLARYQARLTLGWPCWLGGQGCKLDLPAPATLRPSLER